MRAVLVVSAACQFTQIGRNKGSKYEIQNNTFHIIYHLSFPKKEMTIFHAQPIPRKLKPANHMTGPCFIAAIAALAQDVTHHFESAAVITALYSRPSANICTV